MSSEVKNYNAVSRALHWLSALVIFVMFGVGFWMVDLTYYSSWYKTAPYWHKSVGLLFVLLTLFRLGWKFIKPSPKIVGSKFEVKVAHAVHHLLYLMLIVLFVSGYLISTSDGRGIDIFNWFTVPGMGELFPGQSDTAGLIHKYTAYVLIGMAGVHAVAALKHHFINKDNTLRKMIGASK